MEKYRDSYTWRDSHSRASSVIFSPARNNPGACDYHHPVIYSLATWSNRHSLKATPAPAPLYRAESPTNPKGALRIIVVLARMFASYQFLPLPQCGLQRRWPLTKLLPSCGNRIHGYKLPSITRCIVGFVASEQAKSSPTVFRPPDSAVHPS